MRTVLQLSCVELTFSKLSLFFKLVLYEGGYISFIHSCTFSTIFVKGMYS